MGDIKVCPSGHSSLQPVESEDEKDTNAYYFCYGCGEVVSSTKWETINPDDEVIGVFIKEEDEVEARKMIVKEVLMDGRIKTKPVDKDKETYMEPMYKANDPIHIPELGEKLQKRNYYVLDFDDLKHMNR